MNLEKMKSRWRRWLGQKTRWDKPYWTTLLDCNWSGWAKSVLAKNDKPYDMKTYPSREEIKAIFSKAINIANEQDLIRLDGIFASEVVKHLNL